MNDLVIQRLPLGACQANAYLVWRENREDALMIDPGDGLPALRAAVAASGRRLTDILLTHGHFDHVLGAPALARELGARVHVHSLDAAMLATPEGIMYSPRWCETPFEAVNADAPYPEDAPFSLEVCGLSLRGFHTPGHTRGSVCLLDEEHRALFTGDTLFAEGYGRTDFPGGSDADMRASLAFLLGLERGLTVYSGHGEADTMDAIARRWGR